MFDMMRNTVTKSFMVVAAMKEMKYDLASQALCFRCKKPVDETCKCHKAPNHNFRQTKGFNNG